MKNDIEIAIEPLEEKIKLHEHAISVLKKAITKIKEFDDITQNKQFEVDIPVYFQNTPIVSKPVVKVFLLKSGIISLWLEDQWGDNKPKTIRILYNLYRGETPYNENHFKRFRFLFTQKILKQGRYKRFEAKDQPNEFKYWYAPNEWFVGEIMLDHHQHEIEKALESA